MKKIFSMLMAATIGLTALTGCGSSDASATTDENGAKVIDTLTVAFVPSRDPDEIVTATEPLKGMLKENPNSRTELENIVIPLFNGV